MKRLTIHLFIVALTLGGIAATFLRVSQSQTRTGNRPQSLRGQESAGPAAKTDESPKLYKVWIKGKTGFIDRTGKLVIPAKFPHGYIWNEFSDGMARTYVSASGRPGYCCRFGFINAAGEVVVEPQYWEAEDFSEGLAAVQMGKLWGYIDKQGRTALGPKWIAAQSFKEGLAGVCEEHGDCGYINKRGEWVIRGVRLISHFSEGLAQEMVDGDSRYGYKLVFIDKTGQTVIKGPFEEAWDFKDGVAAVKVNDQIKYIDKTGREVQKIEKLTSFTHKGLFGFKDQTGKVVVPPQLELMFEFSEGLAPVRIRGRWGYIDETGRMVIKPRFYEAYEFDGGIAMVMPVYGRMGYIDKTGRYVWRPSR